MEPFRDDQLIETLCSLRPTPRPAFAAELDARVAAGFPRESRAGRASLAGAVDRLRALKPSQVLLPAGTTALAAILIAAVVVSQNNGGSDSAVSSAEQDIQQALERESQTGFLSGRSGAGSSSSEESASAAPKAADGVATSASGYAADTANRAVERSAELTLGTEPENVGKASGEVFDVVHTYRGIVLRSQTNDGSAGAASAEFELLIPSAKLGDAMAAFSDIAEVRSRHEATTDITAPTVGVAEQLEDSKARIDSLLAQLAAAETESEREAVEAELRSERSRSAVLSSQLQSLERRANLSRLSLRIESGEAGAAPDAGGSWGIGDALDDAGRILAVAAAVTLVGLAVLGPVALIALLAWLAQRAWVRRGRRQALS